LCSSGGAFFAETQNADRQNVKIEIIQSKNVKSQNADCQNVEIKIVDLIM
jgi:hypothetical protein